MATPSRLNRTLLRERNRDFCDEQFLQKGLPLIARCTLVQPPAMVLRYASWEGHSSMSPRTRSVAVHPAILFAAAVAGGLSFPLSVSRPPGGGPPRALWAPRVPSATPG